MTSSPIGGRLTIPIASILACLTLALLWLVAPGRAGGQEPKHLCTPAPHTRHATSVCAQAGGRHGNRPQPKAKRRHAKHTSAKKKSRKRPRTRANAHPPLATPQPGPSCEDGSDPISLRGGSYACGDRSEPACEDGAEPTLSSAGSRLICPVAAGGGPGSTPALCEDASAPVRSPGGSYSCEDESEPECEDGSLPVPSSDGSMLLCNLAPDVESSFAAKGFGSYEPSVRVAIA